MQFTRRFLAALSTRKETSTAPGKTTQGTKPVELKPADVRRVSGGTDSPSAPKGGW